MFSLDKELFDFLIFLCCSKDESYCKQIMTTDPFQGKVQFIQGHASFTDDPEPTVEVNGKKYTAPHILIATGGQPTVMSDADVPGKSDELRSYLFKTFFLFNPGVGNLFDKESFLEFLVSRRNLLKM